MKIEEVMAFLNQFNQKADFKVVMPDGTPIDINKNDFGWSSGGDGGTKMDVVEVCIMLNNSESSN
jgi:hypothetical protein